MTLSEYISLQGWQELSASEIHSRMNEWISTEVDTERYTFAGIANLIGPQNTEELLQTLTASGLSWVNYQLGGAGIMLSDARVQDALFAFEQAGKNWATVLKHKGLGIVTRYNYFVGPGDCTLEMIEA